MTLEEAQNRILELEGQLAEVTNERDTLSQNNNALTTDLENARALNQKLFERVSVAEVEDEPEEEPETAPSCEEFAKTLKIL